MRAFFKLLHLFFFWRALFRGPRYFAGYATRRAARRATYKATKEW